MEIKKLNIEGREVEFVNSWRGTRSGFAHDTNLFINGVHRAEATCHYLNRTWECYTYQTVMKKAIYNLIEWEENYIRDNFKAEKGYKKLTAKRAEELEQVFKENEELKFYRAIYNAL